MKEAPYGSWKSPITTDLLVGQTIGLGQVQADGEDVYWVESRPAEAGRNVVAKRAADGTISDVTPAPFNVRTRVHEYGGGAYMVRAGTIYFSNFADQRLYSQKPGSQPVALTPESQMQLRYANAIFDTKRNRIIAVREDHRNGEQAINVVNTIVSLNVDGDNADGGTVLTSGYDFYSNPRLSSDGSKLAWLSWNHPNMPWDGTELWVADIQPDGSLGQAELVAGGKDESIFQPEWSPENVLYFISDRTNWWNIYRANNGQIEPLCQKDAEFAGPQWVFGLSTYAFENANSLICSYSENGRSHISRLNTQTKELHEIESQYELDASLAIANGKLFFVGGSPLLNEAIVQINLQSGELQILKESSQLKFDPRYISEAQAIEFPTENGLTAHAFFYAPKNMDYTAHFDEKPPLLVKSHGGPTSATSNHFKLGIQWWTSRGFAVLDVNYGGSTGYGREYRQRLNGQWGIVDVNDCVNGAMYLVKQGLVDGNRLAIDGGSAGGYTTLAVLTFRDEFKAGASHFGVSDLEALAQDTHKFESRYMDSMVGPYPETRDIYIQRSPIHFTDKLNCPLILLQGLEDKVVPPAQAETMFEAVRKKGIPVAYIPFEGEQHGFRQAANIKRSIEAEFYFYSQIFGFEPADEIEPVEIENYPNNSK